jgi:hypothetical protein
MRRNEIVSEAIPVPHDGAINYFTFHHVHHEVDEYLYLTEAIHLDDLIPEDTPTKRLWNALRSSSRNRDQLQALQAHRSTLINMMSQVEQPDQRDKTEPYLAGVYRVLLELYLSYKTNQPTRRAIQFNLETISKWLSNEVTSKVTESVVTTLWDVRFWKDSLHTLNEALSYDSTRKVITGNIDTVQDALNLLVGTASDDRRALLENDSFQYSLMTSPSAAVALETTIQYTIALSTTLKVLMTHVLHDPSIKLSPVNRQFKQLSEFIWFGINCRSMHSDGLAKLGLAYGQTLFASWIHLSPAEISELAINRTQQLIADLPPLNALCVVRGITAVLPDQVLMEGSPKSLLQDPLASYLLLQSRKATDGQTRLFALRSLQTLMSRSSSLAQKPEYKLEYIESLAQEILELVMNTWENPPGKQVASAVPALFRELIQLMEAISPQESSFGLEGLLNRVLDQPVNRKGRYIALETLLPITGAQALIEGGGDKLIESLVTGVADSVHAAGNIAVLLGKILSKRREELHQGVAQGTSISKKQRRKLEKEFAKSGPGSFQTIRPILLQEWIDLWAPQFARGLLSESPAKRKQVSAFCVPQIIPMCGGPSKRGDASFALYSLLLQLENEQTTRVASTTFLPSHNHEDESMEDIYLWAKFEIVRHASTQKLLNPVAATPEFLEKLSEAFPKEVIRSALIHCSPHVRIAAFASLDAIISTFASHNCSSKVHAAIQEMSFWKFALPYAFKSAAKEYTSSLLQCLSAFLDRLSLAEAEETEEKYPKVTCLPLVLSFVGDFLIDKMILRQAGYPSTVADKEMFATELVKCVIGFAFDDELLPLLDCRPFRAPSQTVQRTLRDVECKTRRCIREKLFSPEVLSGLLSLVHSMWDGTRTEAFRILSALLEIASRDQVELPKQFQTEDFIRRGLFLASSPRQREAESGAMILAITFGTKACSGDHEGFVIRLIDLLADRVENIKHNLGAILTRSDDDSFNAVEVGSALPLAHGIIQALRLIVEMTLDLKSMSILSSEKIGRIADLCCKSIQMSLSVVADVNDGEILDGMDGNSFGGSEKEIAVPLNVNTGAIGANATFSSIRQDESGEALRRLATQRIVMGSWLLTKEACTTLASTVTYETGCLSSEDVMKAGQLLITTMTALKHQGAAFAAHRALQKIAAFCSLSISPHELRDFAFVWFERLQKEISVTEKVRDSTLRRSTGYALGFLAIMRPEQALKRCPSRLCPAILSNLIVLSLPSKSQLGRCLHILGLSCNTIDVEALFSSALRSRTIVAFDSAKDSRARVHALNVLRLVILDAPLASEVAPYVGDSIVSSMLGYVDESWAVRNSSTMVFSAAMLRVVDSDKNAARKDESGGNAVSAVEFFRLYAPLKPIFLALLRNDASHQHNLRSKSVHSPLLLVLLMIARISPVRTSMVEASISTDAFLEYVAPCLSHWDHKVRVVAARALSNIASIDPDSESYFKNLVFVCERLVTASLASKKWNTQHGALLALKEIVSSAPDDPALLLKETGTDKILYGLLRKWRSSPASCLSVALDTLNSLMNASSVSYDDKVEFVSSCLKLFEACEGSQILPDPIFCATLGCAAAENISDLMWSHTKNTPLFGGQMLRIFKSISYDIRLTAVKRFKKKIYAHIDNILTSTDHSNEEKITVLKIILQMLSDAILTELQRNSTTNSLGAHPPTVRRLSRCLLECLYAHRALTVVPPLSCDHLWLICNQMLFAIDAMYVDSDNIVNGNLAELMAFACNNEERLSMFSSLINRLNDPYSPWRVRLSVAMAIESCIIIWNGCSPQKNLQLQVLRLLQDSDPDVRFVAARCIAGDGLWSAALSSLENAYLSFDDITGQSLVKPLVDRYAALPDRIQSVLDELVQSIGKSQTDALLNVDRSRKIFEEEHPNPYEEPLVACHLTVACFIVKGMILGNTELTAAASKASATALVVLDRLEVWYATWAPEVGILHDPTHHCQLFGDIQGLLVLSTALTYLEVSDFTLVKDKAQSLVSQCPVSVHPDILDTLKVLGNAKPGDEATKSSLQRLCFLVPGGFSWSCSH